jgi:Clostridium P-47 protein
VEESLLAVLCMTNGNDAKKCVPEVTVNAIPTGARAGFLINPARFFQYMVLPNMPHAFPGAQTTDFTLDADGQGLTMSNADGLGVTTTDATGKTYSTTITYISPGLNSYSTSTHTYSIGLVKTPNGKETLGFNAVGDPVVNHWTTQSTGLEILKWMEVAVGAVATLVLGVLTGGAGFIVGAIVIGALVGLATQAPSMVAAIGQDDAPDLSLLAFNTTDPIGWTDTQNFDLTSATLNGSLQLGGKYTA